MYLDIYIYMYLDVNTSAQIYIYTHTHTEIAPCRAASQLSGGPARRGGGGEQDPAPAAPRADVQIPLLLGAAAQAAWLCRAEAAKY